MCKGEAIGRGVKIDRILELGILNFLDFYHLF